MELLRLAGYSPDEKMQIAKRYLIGRRIKESGLAPSKVRILDSAVARIISHYTREAGVRELERTLGRLTRKIARRFAEGRTKPVRVKPGDLAEMLGPERFLPEQARKKMPQGVAAGLAWTETGGEVLYIEAILLPGQKDLKLTGSLGDVMRESAKAAQSYVWAHADELGIDRDKLKKSGAHIHVPAGAVPKDGPSAGVAMVSALASAYTEKAVRQDMAMTGEITLAGLVLPVGGIKEKVLAAHRAGMNAVLLPRENEKDLRQLPKHVRSELQVILADRLEGVLSETLASGTRIRSGKKKKKKSSGSRKRQALAAKRR
jgi:ATP-dependent Lon protease